MGKRRRGRSYEMRVAAVNELYDKFSRTGLSNREIWRRHIYPKYGISERTLYDMLKRESSVRDVVRRSGVSSEQLSFDF